MLPAATCNSVRRLLSHVSLIVGKGKGSGHQTTFGAGTSCKNALEDSNRGVDLRLGSRGVPATFLNHDLRLHARLQEVASHVVLQFGQ